MVKEVCVRLATSAFCLLGQRKRRKKVLKKKPVKEPPNPQNPEPNTSDVVARSRRTGHGSQSCSAKQEVAWIFRSSCLTQGFLEWGLWGFMEWMWVGSFFC